MTIKVVTIVGWGLALALVGTACSKSRALEACAASAGACGEGSLHCGADFSCPDGTKYKLQCTPPASKPPMSCQCIENGVVQKSVQVVGDFTGLDEARDRAATACGWK